MPNMPRSLSRALLFAGAVAVLAAPAAAQAAKRAVVTVPITQIGQPGNHGAAITPFTDAIYQSCSVAPPSPPVRPWARSGIPTGSASSR